MESRWVQSGAAGAVLLGVTLACFQQLATHPRDLLVGPQRGGHNDLTDYFIACRNYPRQCLERFGQWLLWNPYSRCGVPYVGNPQAALFYPPNWLCWWIDARDVLSWTLVAHHLFAGVGAYLLARRYGFGWLAAVTGGAIFLAAPYLVAHTGEGHYAQICTVAWMPWAFLTYEVVRAGTRGGVATLAAVLAMSFFAGHIQETYYLVLILTGCMLVDAFGRWRAGQRAECRRLLVSWLLVGIAAAGLVAADLLPIWVYSRHMVRAGGLNAEQAGAISIGLSNLSQLLDPFALGGPASYRGPGEPRLYWETLCSFGLVPLVLAAVGVLTAWKRYPIARLTCFWLVAIGFAFGAHGPVFNSLYWLVPGISMFRVPSRVLFFCSLAVAILAAAGVDSLVGSERDWSARRQIVWRRMLLVGAAAGLVGLCIGSRSISAWFLGTLLLAYAAVRWPERARPAVCGLFGLCVVQLSLFANKVLATLPAAALRGPSPVTESLSGEIGPFRVLARQGLLSDQQAWDDSIHTIHGYDPVPLSHYVDLFAALTGKPDPVADVSGMPSRDLRISRAELLDLLNVRFAVLGGSSDHFDWRCVAHGSVQPFHLDPEVSTNEPYQVYENPRVLPRAFVVGRVKEIGQTTPPPRPHPPRERGAAGAPVQVPADFDATQEVLLERDVLPTGPRADFGPAKIVEYTPNRVTVEADLSAPGYLVLSDVWYPGWTAAVDGDPMPVLRANVAFRAMPLSAGTHRVVFQYTTPGLILGAVVSLLTWALLIGCGLMQSRRLLSLARASGVG